MHLLLVERDVNLGAALQRAMAAEGLSSEWVRTGHLAQTLSSPGSDEGAGKYACAVVDPDLPDFDGISLVEHWRRRGMDMPVIICSSRSDLAWRVKAFQIGADDCVGKPCDPAELALRVRTVIRRSAGQSSDVWRAGRLEIDTAQRTVRDGDVPVPLSPTEYLLLLELARRDGAVATKRALVQACSPLANRMSPGALEWHVHNLRSKFGDGVIRTVRGVGYRLDIGPGGQEPVSPISRQAGTKNPAAAG